MLFNQRIDAIIIPELNISYQMAFLILLEAAKSRGEKDTVCFGRELLNLKAYLNDSEFSDYCKGFIEAYYTDDEYGETLYEFSLKVEGRLNEEKRYLANEEAINKERSYYLEIEKTVSILEHFIERTIEELDDLEIKSLEGTVMKVSNFFIGNYKDLRKHVITSWNNMLDRLSKELEGNHHLVNFINGMYV